MSASHMEFFQTTHSLPSLQLHTIAIRTQHSDKTLRGTEKLANCDKKLTCSPPLLHKSYFFFRSELKCHFPREDVPRLLSFTSVALPENPLHTNLRVGNSQRCELGFTCPVMLDVSEIVPRPPSPIADNPSALPSPTSSPSSSQ